MNKFPEAGTIRASQILEGLERNHFERNGNLGLETNKWMCGSLDLRGSACFGPGYICGTDAPDKSNARSPERLPGLAFLSKTPYSSYRRRWSICDRLAFNLASRATSSGGKSVVMSASSAVAHGTDISSMR
jgi:hypothetical protein